MIARLLAVFERIVLMFKKFLPFVLLLPFLPVHAQTSAFHFQLFDVPNSASTEADNINARGEITGFFFDQSGRQHGFFHSQDWLIRTFLCIQYGLPFSLKG